MKLLPIADGLDGARVEKAAERRLQESPYFYLRRLRCHCEAGVLTLRGEVPYWQLRGFAEAIVGRVEGVVDVDNRIEVVDPALAPFTAPAARIA